MIEARRVVGAPPLSVHAFLAELGNHWLLGGRHLLLEALLDEGRGGAITLRGPIGTRRRVRTTVTGVRAPSYLGGRAEVGARTVAHVSWLIRALGPYAVVELTAVVVTAGVVDRVLLHAGGRRWLQVRFHEVLDRLADAIGSEGNYLPDR
jgi:hypothetical protein